MSKDPAFLFYPADFIIGTAFMSNEQVGKYIKLMCYQQQLGHLSEEQMLSVCITRDENIFSKFSKDEKGLYFNSRLEKESIKRSSFCKSRRNNASTSTAYAKHMENVNENNNTTEQPIKFLEFVFITQGQYDRLANKLGNKRVDEYIEKLNNYIGSKGKQYKSHYHTILSWTAKDGGINPSVVKPTKTRQDFENEENERKRRQWEMEKQTQ